MSDARADGGEADDAAADLAELREQVEAKYDFEDFTEADMAEMSPEEWEAAFDPDTWITGEELLERVEADLRNRVAERDVFARIERVDDVVIAYSDTGYAAVYPDGTVEGRGTVLRDVKPTVALCSMESYDVPEPPQGDLLPDPQEVPESSDALGNTVLQVVGGVQVLAGLVLLVALVGSLAGLAPLGGGGAANVALLAVAGLGFLLVGVFMFATVANARLSDKFRAEEYRNRLRAVGLEDGERPDFLDEIEGIEGDLPAPDAPGREEDAPGEGEGSTGAGGGPSGTEEPSEGPGDPAG